MVIGSSQREGLLSHYRSEPRVLALLSGEPKASGLVYSGVPIEALDYDRLRALLVHGAQILGAVKETQSLQLQSADEILRALLEGYGIGLIESSALTDSLLVALQDLVSSRRIVPLFVPLSVLAAVPKPFEISRSYGAVRFADDPRGPRLVGVARPPPRAAHEVFPAPRGKIPGVEDDGWFERQDLNPPQPAWNLGAHTLLVSRSNALPPGWFLPEGAMVVTAGEKSWRALTARGVQVQSCFESLGEDEPPWWELFDYLSRPIIKLSHDMGRDSQDGGFYSTYRLIPRVPPAGATDATYFYWRSGSSFQRALDLWPEIADRWHFSGPGSTRLAIQKALSESAKTGVFLSCDDFHRELVVGYSG